MNELSDKELIRVRLRFLDLIKSFFMSEPDAEKMSRWRGMFAALDKEQVSPGMDRAVRRLNDFFSRQNLKSLKEEYYTLFTDPFSDHIVPTTSSHYLNGRSHGESLAGFRDFMKKAALQKDPRQKQSEDSLLVMLDLFSTLIGDEKRDETDSRIHQETLLEEYLEPLSNFLLAALKENEAASFYVLCGEFLREYLSLEKLLQGRHDYKNWP